MGGAVAIRQGAEDRRAEELPEGIEGQQQAQHKAALGQARARRQHAVVVAQDHRRERRDHQAVAEEADEDDDVERQDAAINGPAHGHAPRVFRRVRRCHRGHAPSWGKYVSPAAFSAGARAAAAGSYGVVSPRRTLRVAERTWMASHNRTASGPVGAGAIHGSL